jgi:hypothetical protein
MYLSCGIVILQAYTAASAGGEKHVLRQTLEKIPPVKINGSGAIGIKQLGCSFLF